MPPTSQERDTRVWLYSEPLFSEAWLMSLSASKWIWTIHSNEHLSFSLWLSPPGPIILDNYPFWDLSSLGQLRQEHAVKINRCSEKYQVIFTSLGLLHLYQKYTTHREILPRYTSVQKQSQKCASGWKESLKYFSSALVWAKHCW